MTVNRQHIVDQQGDALYGDRDKPRDPATEGLEDWQLGMWNLLQYVENLEYGPRDRMTNEDMIDIAGIDMHPRTFASKVKRVLGIQRNERGYLILELAMKLREAFNQQ